MADPKKHRLFVEMIDTVGFVDKGDNPGAEIVFLKRAETFDEARNDDKIRREVWDMTETMSRVIHDALFDEGDAPATEVEGVIQASLQQFTDRIKAALPAWLSGEPYGKAKPKENEMDNPDRTTFRKIVDAIGGALGLAAEDVAKELGPSTGGEDDKMADFKLEELPEVAQAEFRKLQERIAELEPKPEPEPVKLAPEVQKRLEDAEKRAKEAEDRLTQLELEKRRTRYIEKAAALKHLPGWTADDGGTLLLKIADALTEEEYGKVEAMLKGADEAIRQGNLMKEVGAGAGGYGTVEQEARAKADEMRKADPALTPEAAMAKVWRMNPDLYQRFETERKARLDERK